MGYILPIQFDQYAQYHNRVESKGEKPVQKLQIEKVKNAYLAPVKLTIKNKTTLPAYFYRKNRPCTEQTAARVYAEITGIGRLLDVRI